MMESALDPHETAETGRWMVEAQHDSRLWQVTVEPDFIEELLVVITGIPPERSSGTHTSR